jgi:hypothetical protein
MSATIHRLPTGTVRPVLQLRIELLGITPKIWRRVWVPDTITLSRLHRTIQAAMGWTDSHLHEFEIARERYGVPDPEWDAPNAPRSEARVRLASCLGGHKQFHYLYDFGDSWEHKVIVEKRLVDDDLPHPLCVDGENACPPEDVGGAPGYADFLNAIESPAHPEHDHYLSWCGGEFDPAAFDLFEANKSLARIKL